MCKHVNAPLISNSGKDQWQSIMPKPDSSKEASLQPEPQFVFLMVEYPQGNTQLVKAAINNYEHDMVNQPHFLLPNGILSGVKEGKLAVERQGVVANPQSLSEPKVVRNEITQFEGSVEFQDPILEEPLHGGECGWESDSVSDDDEVHIISDKPVVCRARATLPINYLYFYHFSDKQVGVFTRKALPKKSKFGPIDGVLDKTPCAAPNRDDSLQLLIRTTEGVFNRLDISDEEKSNWMRYVRIAREKSEVNLELAQSNGALFFTSTRQLKPREELKVWYSPMYAASRNLPLLSGCEENKWMCPDCNFKSSTAETIHDHISEAHNEDTMPKRIKSYKIKKGAKKNSFVVSSTIIHNEDGFQSDNSNSDCSISSGTAIFKEQSWCCTHCERCFNTPTMLNFHMLAHAADNLEASSLETIEDQLNCSTGVQDQNLLSDNQENKPVKCDICSKRLSSTAALSFHVKKHAVNRKYECPICKINFDKVLELKTHVHCHSQNGVFTCSECSKEFTLYKQIRKHIRSFHSARIHKCHICPKRFPSKDKLRKHHLTHTDKKQFLCSDCGKQFKRNDKLQDHMRKKHYLPEEPIIITKTNSTKGGLYGQYTFKCHLCMVGFKRRGMLVNHLANRHPDTPIESIPELCKPILRTTTEYFCQYCDKIYKSASKRKAHILKNHPGEKLPLSNRQLGSLKDLPGHENGTFTQTVGSVTTKPQGCQWCHKQYASKAKLLQHQRMKHNHLLPKSLQSSRRANCSGDEVDRCDELQKSAKDSPLFQESLITLATEYELSETDGHFITEGEFIVDAASLKKALKGECSGLEEILCEEREYLKVDGTSLTGPVVEVWDSLSLSPPPDSPFLPFPR